MLRGFLADSERALTVMVMGAAGLLIVGFAIAVMAMFMFG